MIRMDEHRGVWIDGKHFAWAETESIDTPITDMSTFAIRRAKIPFENGWAMSIVWGHATWSDNQSASTGPLDPSWYKTDFTETPERVEVAIFLKGEWMCHDPFSNVPSRIVRLMAEHMASFPSHVDDMASAVEMLFRANAMIAEGLRE